MNRSLSSRRLRLSIVFSAAFAVLASSLIVAPASVAGAEPRAYESVAGANLRSTQFDAPDVDIAPPARKPGIGRLDSTLTAIASQAASAPKAALKQATAAELEVEAGRIQVEITVNGSAAEARGAVNRAGGEVTGTGNDGHVIQAFVAPAALSGLSRAPGIGHVARPAVPHTVAGDYMTEGDAALGGASWRTGGVTGEGVKVGIIDIGFLEFSDLLGSELPSSVTYANFVDFEDDGEVDGLDVHGTACAEILHDVAPDADLYLAKIETLLDVEEATDWLVSEGVDVISMSLGWQNIGPGDGTGWFNNIVTDARNAGVTWFTAAGNSRTEHWGGASNLDVNGLQIFGSGNVNHLGPDSATGILIPSDYVYYVEVRWNDWVNVDQDFDIYLVRYDGFEWELLDDYGMQYGGLDIQDGSSGQTPTETAFGVTFGDDAVYGFVIHRWDASHAVNFEMFAAADLGIRTTARSIDNSADAANVVAVGAVNVGGYAQEPYSGEGPTNGSGGSASGGSIKPDLAAYANVSTWTYGSNDFAGTSAATPHAAGAAALVLDANPAYTPNQLEAHLKNAAADLGVAGPDNKYGSGRVRLGAAPSGSDVAPPSVTGASGVITAPQTLGTTAAVQLSWPAASDPSGIARYELQSRKGTNAWLPVTLSSPTATSASRTLTVGASYRFRLRATDGAGNTSAWMMTDAAKLRVVQENATSILYTGTWKRVALSGASGGYVKYATAAGAKARLSFTGAAAALVTTVSPGRGIAEVWIDGAFVTTLDTYNSSTIKKRVAYATPRLTFGAHTLEIRVKGTKRNVSSSVRIEIDAFLAWP